MLRDAGKPKCGTGDSYFYARRPASRKIDIASLLHYLECIYITLLEQWTARYDLIDSFMLN